jgi:hypothetical protein
MSTFRSLLCSGALALVVTAAPASAQHRDPAPTIAAQREAMQPLAMLDGVWRGTVTIQRAGAEPLVAPHTERIGPFLDGSIRVIEGRSYKPDGSVAFNAFAIVSYDPATQAYNFRSYAMGAANDFPFRPTADGFVWETDAGPARIRYTTIIEDDAWHEVGERIVPGQPAVRFIELQLQRVGDSDWPAAGAVGPA